MKYCMLKHLLFIPILCCFCITAHAQKNISGKIVDKETNEPIEGVLVNILKSKIKTLSGQDGHFSLTQVDEKSQIQFSFEGYKSVVIKSGSVEGVIALEPVVILDLPYQNMEKGKYLGSISTLNHSIEGIPVQNLSNALTGRLAGLVSRQYSGEPGSDQASLYIRGLRANNSGALVLVDGHERSFSMLEPYEIESVSILKDASATVLYGMRAANGIIFITTKKGHVGKPVVRLDAQFGYQHAVRDLNGLRAYDYTTMHNEARINDGLAPLFSQDDINKYVDQSDPEHYPDIDWGDELLKEGTWMQRYSLDIEGGSKNARYFVAFGALFQPGTFKTADEFTYGTNNDYYKYNFRANFEFDLTSSTLIDVKSFGWLKKNNFPGNYSSRFDIGGEFLAPSVYQQILRTPPTALPLYYVDNNVDGSYLDDKGNRVVPINGKINAENPNYRNPWALLNRNGYSQSETIYGSIMVNLNQKLDFITSGLAADFRFSMDVTSQQLLVRTQNYGSYELLSTGVMKQIRSQEKMRNDVVNYAPHRYTSLDASLSYNRVFGKHGVDGFMFYSQYDDSPDNALPSRYQGGGASLSYNYAERYFLNAAIGIQGSYKFKPGNQVGYFPAVALGWEIANESFWKSVKPYVNQFKLRFSTGESGNDRGVGDWDYLGGMAGGSTVYVGNPMVSKATYRENTVGNQNVTWELAKLTNLGLDLGFLNNRLAISVDAFKDDRSQVYISPMTYNFITGQYSFPRENQGKIKSAGCEFEASWTDKINDFTYFVEGNYSFSRNEIVDYGEALLKYDYLYSKGRRLSTYTGFISNGFFDSYEEIVGSPTHTLSQVKPGDIRYLDINGDGKVTSEYDMVPIGNPTIPEFFYGLNLGGAYKGFDFAILFQGAANMSSYISNYAQTPFYRNGKIFEHQTNRWTPETASTASLPKYTTSTTNANNSATSDFYLRDASYLRVKTIELGYTIPQTITQKALIQNLRLYVSGYNLFVWDKIDFLDPEGYLDGYSYPIQRVFNMGVKLTF